MGHNHPCNIEGIGTVHIKTEDGMVRELKEVMYVKVHLEGVNRCTANL